METTQEQTQKTSKQYDKAIFEADFILFAVLAFVLVFAIAGVYVTATAEHTTKQAIGFGLFYAAGLMLVVVSSARMIVGAILRLRSPEQVEAQTKK